jgi:hypothetical protein
MRETRPAAPISVGFAPLFQATPFSDDEAAVCLTYQRVRAKGRGDREA